MSITEIIWYMTCIRWSLLLFLHEHKSLCQQASEDSFLFSVKVAPAMTLFFRSMMSVVDVILQRVFKHTVFLTGQVWRVCVLQLSSVISLILKSCFFCWSSWNTQTHRMARGEHYVCQNWGVCLPAVDRILLYDILSICISLLWFQTNTMTLLDKNELVKFIFCHPSFRWSNVNLYGLNYVQMAPNTKYCVTFSRAEVKLCPHTVQSLLQHWTPGLCSSVHELKDNVRVTEVSVFSS